MKHIFIFITVIVSLCFCVSCEEEKIELYSQEPRINFDYKVVYGELVDTDYVMLKSQPYRTDSFRVRIQGALLTASRNFCVKQTVNKEYENTMEIQIEPMYTFSKLDGTTQSFCIKVKRPPYKSGNKAYGCNLVFDNQNSSHQFLKGIINDSQTIVNYVWRITQPDNWWDFSWQGWGDFSVSKYCYIMDVLGYTFDKIKSEDDSNSALQKVIAAYKEYKKTHAPIVDDKGNDIFPEEAQDK